MSLLARQAALITEFDALPDWEARYARIIALGKALPPFPAADMSEANRVRGCSSQVWLTAKRDERGNIRYAADSDAIIVRGLVAILLRIYDDAPPKDILATAADVIPELGLDTHLSANRANGLAAMVRQIKTYALALGGA